VCSLRVLDLVCSFGINTYCSLFVNDTATSEIYTLSLHDALPIWLVAAAAGGAAFPAAALAPGPHQRRRRRRRGHRAAPRPRPRRSEEHTSELQSRENLVCRLLLEKKKNPQHNDDNYPC